MRVRGRARVRVCDGDPGLELGLQPLHGAPDVEHVAQLVREREVGVVHPWHVRAQAQRGEGGGDVPARLQHVLLEAAQHGHGGQRAAGVRGYDAKVRVMVHPNL